jgi:hypothetical protein
MVKYTTFKINELSKIFLGSLFFFRTTYLRLVEHSCSAEHSSGNADVEEWTLRDSSANITVAIVGGNKCIA